MVSVIFVYLDSIFYNFFINVIKYGMIKIFKNIIIEVYLYNDIVMVFVKDFGLGIDLDCFCDKFFQLGFRLYVVSVEGQGLGLYMIKNQIEGLGGQIELDSEVGKGIIFRVMLFINVVDFVIFNFVFIFLMIFNE